ncbi:MAG: hypothetical protein ACKO2K_18285 [Alphaproteobacteria bacterium]
MVKAFLLGLIEQQLRNEGSIEKSQDALRRAYELGKDFASWLASRR